MFLPPEMRIDSADDLTFTSTRGGQWKQKFVYNSYFIFIINLIVLIQKLFAILTNENNPILSAILSVPGEYFGMRIHYSVFEIQASIVIIFSLTLYYYKP